MNDDTPQKSDSAPPSLPQPTVTEQGADMDKRIDTEHLQFLRLLAQVNDELERVFVAMCQAAGVEQQWCTLAYTHAQMSMMEAKRALYDGLADDNKRRQLRDRLAEINAAPMN